MVLGKNLVTKFHAKQVKWYQFIQNQVKSALLKEFLFHSMYMLSEEWESFGKSCLWNSHKMNQRWPRSWCARVAEGVVTDPHDFKFTADISRETNQIIESWNHVSLTKTSSQLTEFSYRNISTCHLCIYWLTLSLSK